MSKIKFVGQDAPLILTHPAPPSADEVRPAKGRDSAVVVSLEPYPRGAMTFWVCGLFIADRLTSARGENVRPRLQTLGVAANGVEGVVGDPTTGELNTTRFQEIREALGWIRVDHLLDENGEPLGIISPKDEADRKKLHDFCCRLLNPARLLQLGHELRALGRDISDKFDPQISDALVRVLNAQEENGKINWANAVKDYISSKNEALVALFADVRRRLDAGELHPLAEQNDQSAALAQIAQERDELLQRLSEIEAKASAKPAIDPVALRAQIRAELEAELKASTPAPAPAPASNRGPRAAASKPEKADKDVAAPAPAPASNVESGKPADGGGEPS